MRIGFVNFSKHWVSRQVQLPLSLFSLALIFREVQAAFAVGPRQPSIIKAAVESDAAASEIVAKRAGSKRDIASLLASKSSLREAILIREILGPPRGLEALDAMV